MLGRCVLSPRPLLQVHRDLQHPLVRKLWDTLCYLVLNWDIHSEQEKETFSVEGKHHPQPFTGSCWGWGNSSCINLSKKLLPVWFTKATIHVSSAAVRLTWDCCRSLEKRTALSVSKTYPVWVDIVSTYCAVTFFTVLILQHSKLKSAQRMMLLLQGSQQGFWLGSRTAVVMLREIYIWNKDTWRCNTLLTVLALAASCSLLP